MDPINAAASLLTLLQVGIVLGNAAVELYQNIHDAPAEITSIANLVTLLNAQLAQLISLTDEEHDDLIPSAVLATLVPGLEAAAKNVQDVSHVCQKLARDSKGIHSRLRWAVLDRRVAEKALMRLRATESSLVLTLQIFGVHKQGIVLTKLEDINRAVRSIADSHITHVLPRRPAWPARLQQTQLKTDYQESTDPRVMRVSRPSVGFLGSLVRTCWSQHTDWSLAVHFSLPFGYMTRSYAFQVQIAFRTFPLCRSLSLNNGSGVALAKVIPEASTYMRACALGDVGTVRSLLRSGQARPTDVTEKNWSPLALSILSGNLDLVQLFLDSGASVNWTFGRSQTSPLQFAISSKQLDIVRLLLRHGADQDHISALGWSSMFYCWPLTRQGEPTMLEFIELLAGNAYQDLALIDEDGWMCLHRVAAFGSPEELQRLIKLGADPRGLSLPLSWNAIQHACFYGNMPCYEALVPLFEAEIPDMSDERGWSLLHLAAASGSEPLIKALLQKGVSPDQLSKPSVAGTMHESIVGKRCSPRDIATLEGEYHVAIFDHAVASFVEDQDVFYDAEDSMNLDTNATCLPG